jgi:hypothetical protein
MSASDLLGIFHENSSDIPTPDLLTTFPAVALAMLPPEGQENPAVAGSRTSSPWQHGTYGFDIDSLVSGVAPPVDLTPLTSPAIPSNDVGKLPVAGATINLFAYAEETDSDDAESPVVLEEKASLAVPRERSMPVEGLPGITLYPQERTRIGLFSYTYNRDSGFLTAKLGFSYQESLNIFRYVRGLEGTNIHPVDNDKYHISIINPRLTEVFSSDPSQKKSFEAYRMTLSVREGRTLDTKIHGLVRELEGRKQYVEIIGAIALATRTSGKRAVGYKVQFDPSSLLAIQKLFSDIDLGMTTESKSFRNFHVTVAEHFVKKRSPEKLPDVNALFATVMAPSFLGLGGYEKRQRAGDSLGSASSFS